MDRLAIRRAALCGMLGILLAGCGSTSLGSRMDSWEGSTLTAVAAAWGPPDRCETVLGRRLCHWLETSPAYMPASGNQPPFARVLCVRTLEIDARDRVIGWRWRGDNCADTKATVAPRMQSGGPATSVAMR